ncbi:MAG: MFS transporter [Pararhodobacter sp.]
MQGSSGLGALKVPAFRRYFAGSVLGMNATWIFRVLLSWSAWDLTHSASFVGLVAALSLLPVALTGPVFGALTDRADVRRAFFRVTLGFTLCPLIFMLLSWTGWLAPVPLLVLSGLYGVLLSAYHPVRQSIAPRLVEPPLIGSVVALAALNFNVGRMLSPAIGGALIARIGLVPTSLVVLLLFVPSIVISLTLTPRDSVRTTARASFLSDLRAGLGVAWRRWPIRRSLLLSVFALGPVRAVAELLALIADGNFGRGAEGLGLLTSAIGFGALFAALFQVFAGQALLRRHAVRYGFVALGFLATGAMVLAPDFDTALLAAPFAGFSATYVGVSLQIGLQARLEDGMRGRIMSLWMLATTLSTSVLAVAVSAASDFVGLAPAALTAAGLGALAVLAIALRRGDDE